MENQTAPINLTIEKNYDSEFCGSIPLHLVNLIQPHGVLLVLEKQSLRIIQLSENVHDFFATSLESILERPLSDFLPDEQYRAVSTRIATQSSNDKIPFNFTFTIEESEVACTALIHPKEEYVLVELEKSTPYTAANSFMVLYQRIKYITSELKQATSTADTAQVAAEALKEFTGFDRVLFYQFDPQWNGIVIAQAKEEEMDDYMDLRFPASDVPKQARDLYFKNPYRLIPTREYEPVRLLPIVNPLSQSFTDLSECNLRSVASVHLEYLHNLNIKASMSLPLIIEDKLWGLISCHHQEKMLPSYEMRSALELLSGIISAQLAAKEKEKAILRRVKLRGIYAQLLEQLYSSSSFTEGLLNKSSGVLELLNLSGVAVLYGGSIMTSGATPDQQEIKDLVAWLRRNKNDKLFITDNLPKLHTPGKFYKDLASGLIALSINAEEGEYILGFRPEVLQTVSWGGNPNQAIQMEADGKTYHPRNSFATYKETVKFTSLPWYEEEVEAAEALRSAVLEKIIKERY
ncbi:GAF domain-containing protein [Pontibacter sp. SGAir0037]|uniref:GAF domain-containing protein n=1 Tax=Pontibacter sp. SGAir0037 TaxID=2571030 RepID=UPI0010CD41A7|nr:GAF domain-containing protein [Pontibacter sp. SGAir0037]QCR22056.1 PAS sensor protein [Pontibacter sp. SGAir0037]